MWEKKKDVLKFLEVELYTVNYNLRLLRIYIETFKGCGRVD